MDMKKLTEWQAERVYQKGLAGVMAKMEEDFTRDWDALWDGIYRDLYKRIKGGEPCE